MLCFLVLLPSIPRFPCLFLLPFRNSVFRGPAPALSRRWSGWDCAIFPSCFSEPPAFFSRVFFMGRLTHLYRYIAAILPHQNPSAPTSDARLCFFLSGGRATFSCVTPPGFWGLFREIFFSSCAQSVYEFVRWNPVFRNVLLSKRRFLPSFVLTHLRPSRVSIPLEVDLLRPSPLSRVPGSPFFSPRSRRVFFIASLLRIISVQMSSFLPPVFLFFDLLLQEAFNFFIFFLWARSFF